MHYFKRLTYLLYYLRETDFKQLHKFNKYASEISGLSLFRIFLDSIFSSFKYNVSLKDYYCFRFFSLSDEERKKWAGTGYMFEYQLIMNPRGKREVLADKIKFLKSYKDYVSRNFYSLGELSSNSQFAEKLLHNNSGRIVLKESHGQIGAEVEVISSENLSGLMLIEYMKKNHYNLAEEYVIQHPELMRLSPSGLNTVRVFTQLKDGKVDFLGARLRISVNSQVDNMAAGNLAASIDLKTGVVNGPGVYSDITKDVVQTHPITGQEIIGFTIPYWRDVLEMTEKAALHIPENKSIGWDIAITTKGPEIIEGNHNWCKLLWQMPVRKGLKNDLEKYLH